MDLLRQELKDYMDSEDRLLVWPCGRRYRDLALEYIASKFETGRSYTLQEVNAIINRFHSFDQAAMLRSELFENGLLDCTSDGSEYWKVGP
ncbi:MAG: DUF2087 domain-containing protein [Eubacteriales bacterium]|jgi:hypothetical protein|nr:DUF2087 domain-containing protein [Eubacteriales bacterium]MDD3072989.1 DUF2087 domain-containing protein [Eubacteriales bacterium]MDD4079358.1 DUF2087 domain-containing protein [Eubacteriales bacterium]MDD4768946.1 DUF2087 domain-containing protein [Eubacteriales bacterium]